VLPFSPSHPPLCKGRFFPLPYSLRLPPSYRSPFSLLVELVFFFSRVLSLPSRQIGAHTTPAQIRESLPADARVSPRGPSSKTPSHFVVRGYGQRQTDQVLPFTGHGYGSPFARRHSKKKLSFSFTCSSSPKSLSRSFFPRLGVRLLSPFSSQDLGSLYSPRRHTVETFLLLSSEVGYTPNLSQPVIVSLDAASLRSPSKAERLDL